MENVTTTVETITPVMANEYLSHNLFNRKLNAARVDYYLRMLKKGQWQLNGESIIFDEDGILRDGQHRLQAAVIGGISFKSVVVRGVTREAFKTIDQGAPRSASDAFGMVNIPNACSIAAAIKKYKKMRVVNAASISVIRTTANQSKKRVSIQDHFDTYEERPEFWQNEHKFATACYRRYNCILTVSDIVAISAYLQLDKGYSGEVVHDFFTQIYYDEHTRNDTLAAFRRTILNDNKSRDAHLTMLYKTQILIKAWEAYKKDKYYKRLHWNKDTDGVNMFH